jgi:hypothetical protein
MNDANRSEAFDVLSRLWRWADCDPAALDRAKLTGRDTVLPPPSRLLADTPFGRLRTVGSDRAAG